MEKEFFIERGEVGVKGEALLMKAFHRLPKGRYKCSLKSVTKRSLNQNSYIHVCFTLAQKGLYDAGWEYVTTPRKAKDEYKKMFLTIEVVNKHTGEVKPYTRHTSELTKEEMTEFINQVRDYALEYTGVYIPTPEEYKANYKKYDLVTLAA